VLTLTVLVDPSAAATVNNTAHVATINDTNTGNNASTLTGTPVSGAPDVQLTKAAVGAFQVGQTATYRLVAKNIGSVATVDTVRLVDTLPAGLTFVSATSATATCVNAAGIVSCKRPPPLAAADSDVVLLTVTVASGALPNVTNRAWAQTAGDANAANNAGSATTPVSAAPDLQMTKAGPATLVAGQPAAYTLTVKNVGSAATSAPVVITDTLNAALSYVFASGGSFACGVSGQVVTCTRAAALLAGDSAVVTLNTTVGPSAIGTIGNRAWVATAGDPNTGNNAGSAPAAPVNTAPDLALAKTATSSFVVGRSATFRLVARNVGSGPTSSAITLTDVLPAGLGFVSGTGTGWTCGAAGQTVTCTNAGVIVPGDSSVVTLTVNVLAGALPSVVNSATVTTAGDPTAANDASATPAIPVTVAPDLALTKVSQFASYLVGDTARFFINARNVGSGPTTGPVTLTDTLPAGLTYLASLVSTYTCGATGNVVTCARATPMLVNDTAGVVILAQVGSGASGSLVNRAWAATAGDGVSTNDSASTPAIAVAAVPDVRLVKRVVGTLAVGAPGTYQFAVQNAGFAPTSGVTTLVDSLPVGVTFTSASGAGWACASTPARIVTCTRATPIPAQDSSLVTMSVAVAAAALPSVTNTAHVSTPGEVVATNNAGTTGVVPVQATPDLQLAKTAVGAFTVGAPATYTLTVRNVGTGTTTDTIRVVDSLPAALTFVSATGPSFTCATAAGVVTCLRTAPLAVNATAVVTVIATPTQAALPTVSNVARVSTPGDNVGGNDRSTTSTAVTGLADIAMAKTGGDTLSVGGTASYTVTATNVGNLTVAAGFTVVDSLPTGLTFQAATSAGFGCAAAGRAVTCTSTQAITPGSAVPITLTTLVTKAAFPAVTNRVAASVAGDADTTNNRASKASVVRGIVDLDVKKTAGSAQFTSGIDNTWLLRVANRGNVPTQGPVSVVDTLPAGLTFTSGTGPGWTCTAAGAVVTCASSTPIADADSVLLTLKTRAASTLTGSITNCATGVAALDANTANDRSCATVTVLGDFRLSILKTSRSQVVEVGGTNDYTVTVRNIGLSPVPAVQLNDVLPQGFAYQLGTSRLDGVAFADPSGGAGPALTWPLGQLNPGEERKVSYRVKIGTNLRTGTAVNRATASSGTIVVQANNAAAPVVVRRGVFSDRGVIVGKVFASCDCTDERMQTRGELGIPGVRVYLEDGTSAITDAEGKYNFWDVSSATHVVKVDATTLPANARLVVTSNRNALDPDSRFVDIKGGELGKADFATAADPDVLTEVRARRRKGEPEAAMIARRADGSGQPVVADSTGGKGGAAVSAPAGAAAGAPAGATSGVPAGATPSVTAGLPASAAPAAPALPPVLEETSRWEGSREGASPSDTVPPVATPVLPVAPTLNRLPAVTDATSNLPATPLRAAQQLPGSGTAAGKVEIGIAGTAYPADGSSAIPVTVRLFDAKGNKLTGRVPVTLEASLGRWLVGNVDRTEEGAQVVVTDGEGTFKLSVPGQPGRGEIRVTSPNAQAALPITFTPAARPLVVAGLFSGRIDLSAFSGGSFVTSAPDQAFEQRLSTWSFSQDSGKVRGGVRAALFAKGTVFTDQLLTLGFDSERDETKTQFRDISPEEMYPTYGDGSIREFDGQSQRRLYARLDRGASFSRFGDFTTQRGTDSRVLGAWDRSLNGIQHHEEGSLGAGNVYLARGTIRQVIDELPGRGISGPYFLSKPNSVINSERVEILTRDRNQPALILSAKPMTRFADYTVEPFTGRLLFRAPVPSLDANFNPVSIRVTYELDQGGAAYNTYGADGTLKLGSRLEIGGIAALDENPLDSLKLFGANASYRFAERTVGVVEVAQATGINAQEGRAGRFELRHGQEGFEARIYGARAGTGFANRSATFGSGRQELGARATLAMTKELRLLAEALETEDLRTGGKRDGALVTLERNFGSAIRAELGYRWARETGAASAGTVGLLVPPAFSALRAKLTAKLPGSEKSSVFAEAEKDMGGTAMRASLGGEYLIASKARAYVRHEWIDGYAGPYALTTGQSQQNTVFGVDADYMKNAQVFSEYRERDAINGRDAEASIGLRNRWAIGQGLLFNTSLERVAPLAGAGQGNATAVTGALEWTRPATTKATIRAEWRRANSLDGYLFSAGVAEKLARDWTLLTRGLFDQQGGIGDRLRTHVGLAWRETDENRWSGLLHWEYRRENVAATSSTTATGYDAHIVAGLLNWQPTGRLVLSGRLAAKFATDRSEGFVTTSDAQLVMARATYDLTPRWDVGLITSLLLNDGGAARTYGLGAEVGRIVMKNLRLAAGYNLFGYRDRDLSSFGYTMKGAYLDFAFKFDESLFGRGSAPSAPASRTR
jgi:uncharacterized repeat protein (TIGR01451 family)